MHSAASSSSRLHHNHHQRSNHNTPNAAARKIRRSEITFANGLDFEQDAAATAAVIVDTAAAEFVVSQAEAATIGGCEGIGREDRNCYLKQNCEVT